MYCQEQVCILCMDWEEIWKDDLELLAWSLPAEQSAPDLVTFVSTSSLQVCSPFALGCVGKSQRHSSPFPNSSPKNAAAKEKKKDSQTTPLPLTSGDPQGYPVPRPTRTAPPENNRENIKVGESRNKHFRHWAVIGTHRHSVWS